MTSKKFNAFGIRHKISNKENRLWKNTNYKGFLIPGNSTQVRRNGNNKRRKCDIIFYDCIDKIMFQKLQSSSAEKANETTEIGKH